MAAMRFKQVQRFILAKKYFGVMGSSSFLIIIINIIAKKDGQDSHQCILINYREKKKIGSISLKYLP